MARKDTEEQPEAGGSKKKLIIIIAATLVVLIGAGVGVFLFMGTEKQEKLSPEQQQAEIEKQAKMVGPMVNIDTFIVNIIDDEESRYLKASITVEVNTPEATMEIAERMPQIKDAILLQVGNKTYAELRDLQGKLQLRAELLNKINSILVKGQVKRIYFTDFVVQ
jgi:flagellar FliL protein